MMMMMVRVCLLPLLLLLVALFVGVLDQVLADCNVCSAATNAACVSNTQFMFCQNNVPVKPLNNCPNGSYCTGFSQICNANPSEKACDECKKCDDSGHVACLGVRRFALCLGTQTASNIIGTCAPYLKCNRNNPNICGDATTGFEASCPLVNDELATTTTTTGPIVDVDLNAYCQIVQQHGRFPYGTNVDTTCKQYVYCITANNTWVGALYNCPGSTYFQPSAQLCNTSIPSTCSTAVTSLRMNRMLLV